MPPLQHSSTFDPMAVIPFSDHASPFDKLFESDLTVHHPQQTHFATSYQQQQQLSSNNSLPCTHDTVPSEAEITALFGLAPANTPTKASNPNHTSAAVSVPNLDLSKMENPPNLVQSNIAPPAPAAHFSSPQHSHFPQEKGLITPIPASPTFYNGSNLSAFSNSNAVTPNIHQTTPTGTTTPNKFVHHQYRCYDSTLALDQTQKACPADWHTQQYQQYQNSTPLHQNQNNSNIYTNADYSQYEYSYATDDTMSKKTHLPANPLMLNPPSRSIFSKFGGGKNGNDGLSNESQSMLAPKLKVAASYVSSTLAVTSTFASEKLATASTKIADLWQQNQHSLPQQRPQQRPPSQQQQQQEIHHNQEDLYNHGHYYEASNPPSSTINSDPSNNQSDMQYSYDGQGLSADHTFNSNYQSSYNNNSPSERGAYNSYSSNNNDISSRNPFASTATSTLSNAASVAGSYLPSLSKLPALPVLSALPALRALPTLPWVSRDKNQQLPQQQPLSDQQYYQYPTDEKNPSGMYYSSYPQSQDSSYQQPHAQQHYQPQQQGHNYQYNAANWWGGLKNEVQKGRRMVQNGVQVGVAWWWDSSEKYPLGGVV
ncbi:hypothetical protein FBU30_011161 [Linnemannia zychae]|nr:hypothetical protein FBU30_011161 [Linnemannia zychae]